MKLFSQIPRPCLKIDKHRLYAFFKPVLILFVIYTIVASAILRANFNYIDDMGRAYANYTGWGAMSRYVSVYLSQLIHTDTILTDISPLPQYLALFLIAITAVCLIYLFQGHLQMNCIQYIAAISLAFVPHFLECLSYKFDAPYMVLSILVSVIPLLFRKKHSLLYFAISTLSILTVCMTYQASTGMYPVLVIILATKDWNQRQSIKDILKFIGISVLSYCSAILFFKYVIMTPVDSYISTELFSPSQMIFGFLRNLRKYYYYFRVDYKPVWLVLSVICIAAYLWTFIRDSQQNKLFAALVGIISLAFIAVLAFGLYPAFVNPYFVPRAMYGFGIATAMLTMAMCSCKKIYIGKIACIALSWCFVVFSFSYGNALAAQAEYTNYRSQMIAESINELVDSNDDEPYYLKIRGTIGFAASVPEDPLISRLVPITLAEDWVWGVYGLVYYYALDNAEIFYPETGDMPMDNPERVVDTALYSIDVSDRNVLITLN